MALRVAFSPAEGGKEVFREIQDKASDYIIDNYIIAAFTYEYRAFGGGQPYRGCGVAVWHLKQG